MSDWGAVADRTNRKLRRKVALAQEDNEKNLKHALENQKKDLEQARNIALVEAEKSRRRADADAADLRATISRLEVDLMKVTSSLRLRARILTDMARIGEQEQVAGVGCTAQGVGC